MESSGKAGGDDAEVSQSVTFFSLEFWNIDAMFGSYISRRISKI